LKLGVESKVTLDNLVNKEREKNKGQSKVVKEKFSKKEKLLTESVVKLDFFKMTFDLAIKIQTIEFNNLKQSLNKIKLLISTGNIYNDDGLYNGGLTEDIMKAMYTILKIRISILN